MINERWMVLSYLSTFERAVLCPRILQNRSDDPRVSRRQTWMIILRVNLGGIRKFRML